PFEIGVIACCHPDTVWTALLINRMVALSHWFNPPDPDTIRNPCMALIFRIGRDPEVMSARRVGPRARTEAMARLYRRNPALVDSVTVISDNSLDIYWRGKEAAMYPLHVWMDGSSTPRERTEGMLYHARSFLDELGKESL